MIVLHVTYKCKPDKRWEFLEIIQKEAIDKASRKEIGNITYDYFISVNNPDVIFLVEKWKDEMAIEIHKTMPHFARLGELKEEYVEDTSIEKYEME